MRRSSEVLICYSKVRVILTETECKMANLRRLQNYEGFIQFMNKEFSSFLKKDFRKEIRGVGVKYKRFPLIERENVIGETLGMMEARWEKSLFDDKRYNPLIGFHSVSGGGKSYLVDELVGLNLKDGKNPNHICDI